MHFQTGPSDLSTGARPGKAEVSAAPGAQDNHDSTRQATRRLAQFYLAHWPEEQVAAILPALRRYAVITPDET